MDRVSLEDFETLKLLGRGMYGDVLLVQKRSSGKLFAMKVLKKQHLNARQVENTLTERSILERMTHPFIIKLHYAFRSKTKLYLILEYCQGGELFFHLERAYRFHESLAQFYAACIVLALEHLHLHNIVYRDLKPENILIDADGYAKITDFGLSKENIIDNTSKTVCGTVEYLAPEVIQKKGYGKAIDWWSLGCLIYEMIGGSPPFYSEIRQELYVNILRKPVEFPSVMSPLAKNLVAALLTKDPAIRLGSASDLKAHPWFANIDWEGLKAKRVKPPYIPAIGNPAEATNFSPEFTNDSVETELEASPPTDSPTFRGFEYDETPQEPNLKTDVHFQ